MKRCDHCHLEYEDDIFIEETIDGENKYFCCKGCQGVYHLLKESNLENFYDKVKNVKLSPPKDSLKDSSMFDLDSFKKRYVKSKDGFSEISLIIEGIHCSACVWLNEKVLHKKDGIIEANINFTTHKAKIIFDENKIKLSNIIDTIRAIGYDAYAYDPSLQEERANKSRKEYYNRMVVAIFGTMNIMWIAVPRYIGYFSGLEPNIKDIFHIAEFILSTPVLFYSGWIFFRGAYYGLKNRFINMDSLVATGATLIYIYSIYMMITREGETYFDSVSMVVTFVLIGKFLEVLSKKSASDVLDTINSKIPTEVRVLKESNLEIVSIYDIKEGDIIELLAGERVVIDGEIVFGCGSFDESSITGEATPIYKKEQDKIISGSINLDSTIRYKATHSFSNSTLSKIMNILEDAMSKKPQIEAKANELSKYFSIAILSISLFTFLFWYLNSGFSEAFIIAVAVIIIACPCALALATPISTLVGLGVATKKGIIFKEAKFLETIAKADILLIDKTGTITEGKPKVINSIKLKDYDKNLLYSLVSNSKHPISLGVKEYLESCKLLNLEDIKTIQARGVKAKFANLELLGGSLEFMSENGINLSHISDKSIFAFAINSEVVEIFELFDKPKIGAKEVIKKISDIGIETVILSGDNENAVREVAKELNINSFKYSLKPEDKLQIVENYQNSGKVVIMAGDGINDSIALSKADIAVAMGSGADVAIEISDIVLLNSKLEALRDAILIGKTTYKFVKQNIGISIIYNSLTIPLAMSGFIIPLFASLSMSLSSLIVVLNSFRIKKEI